MTKQPNKFGGGANTNRNGLHFEQTTSLNAALEAAGYTVKGNSIYRGDTEIGLSLPQKRLYTYFLNPQGINYHDYNSKEWHPDEAFINYENKTVYIIEKKFQNCTGSVDEKLPNCHFKKLEYQKLFTPLQYSVVFVYVLNDWFKDPRYRDTLQYVKDMGCHYYYNEIPLDLLGL